MGIVSRTAVVGLAVAVALTFCSANTFAKGNKAAAKGLVTAVDNNSVTVDSKKTGSQKFTVTATTVYEKAGKKGEAAVAATLADVQVGALVELEGATDGATKVTIVKSAKAGGKSKKNK
jgi:hypothetical protein